MADFAGEDLIHNQIPTRIQCENGEYGLRILRIDTSDNIKAVPSYRGEDDFYAFILEGGDTMTPYEKLQHTMMC